MHGFCLFDPAFCTNCRHALQFLDEPLLGVALQINERCSNYDHLNKVSAHSWIIDEYVSRFPLGTG